MIIAFWKALTDLAYFNSMTSDDRLAFELTAVLLALIIIIIIYNWAAENYLWRNLP
jgi:heme/copper-type cytochrome/quinol oxidase subunit 4